jgi:hypothetical protein
VYLKVFAIKGLPNKMKHFFKHVAEIFFLTCLLVSCSSVGTGLETTDGGTGTPVENVVYYYFVNAHVTPYPDSSIVIMPDAYVLAPTEMDQPLSADPGADLRTALQAILQDGRNGWNGADLEISKVSLAEGHAEVVLLGEYYGVGDVTLIAARMQILLTVFANPDVQTATISLNDDTIANLGVSNSMDAKAADYVFSRAEVEAYMRDHVFQAP